MTVKHWCPFMVDTKLARNNVEHKISLSVIFIIVLMAYLIGITLYF